MHSDDEIWLKSPTLKEYEVSSLGRVRRIPHTAVTATGKTRTYGGKAWMGAWDDQQSRYTLQYQGKTYRVARLICEAFHGPAPFPEAVVMHVNERSFDNRAANLAWGTQKENLAAPKFRKRLCDSRRGGLKRKLSNDDVNEIRRLSERGFSTADLARGYEVSACHVSRIVNGHHRKGA